MPKLGVFSGAEVCRLLVEHGFEQVRQRGSHAVMQRRLNNTTITIPIPLHRELCTGTLRAIIRQSGLAREIFER